MFWKINSKNKKCANIIQYLLLKLFDNVGFSLWHGALMALNPINSHTLTYSTISKDSVVVFTSPWSSSSTRVKWFFVKCFGLHLIFKRCGETVGNVVTS